VLNGFDSDDLYDLEADTHEMINLATDPAYAGVLREMATRMWRRVHETSDFDLIHSHYGMFRYAPVGPNVVCRDQTHSRNRCTRGTNNNQRTSWMSEDADIRRSQERRSKSESKLAMAGIPRSRQQRAISPSLKLSSPDELSTRSSTWR
jgi:hypothetical protein